MVGGGGLEFRLLGPVEAAEDGRNLALGGPKQRALLADLILNAGSIVSTAPHHGCTLALAAACGQG